MSRTATINSCRTPARTGMSLFSWLSFWKSRRDLARLDARMRDDLGLTAHQVRTEASRPVWDVPGSWHR